MSSSVLVPDISQGEQLHFSSSNAQKTKAILDGLCANARTRQTEQGDSGSFRAIVPGET